MIDDSQDRVVVGIGRGTHGHRVEVTEHLVLAFRHALVDTERHWSVLQIRDVEGCGGGGDGGPAHLGHHLSVAWLVVSPYAR